MSGLHGATEARPLLDYLGCGTQNRVFGFGGLAVKVPRWSVLGLLSLFLKRRGALDDIGVRLPGLVLPFRSIGRVEFRAPLECRPDAATKVFRARRAVVLPRIPPGDWLDARFYGAAPAEAARCLGEMLDLLDAIQARGYYMIDFIMGNFVYLDGRLLVSDPGLVVPASLLRWHPSYLISAWQFRIWLARDYDRLLAGKEALLPPGAEETERFREFRVRFRRRVRSLGRSASAGEFTGPDTRCPMPFPENSEQAARRLGCL